MKQENKFKECLRSYFIENEFKDFFNPWFREYGKSYFFAFKKNLKVTNIQYAELISLIQANITVHNTLYNFSIQFLSVSEFGDTVSQLFDTFNSNSNNEEEILLDTIEELYSPLIKHIIVVEAFYGSCAIYLPYNIDLNIEKVCALSGYIHSCGYNIFTRKISKTKKETFFDSLKNHLETNYKDKTDKIPFTLYSHEDFTPYDRDEAKDFFVNGLDNIKFYAEKLYMQSIPLTEVIEEMENHEYLKEKLDIAKAGDYHHNIKGDKDNIKNSIWLIIDRTVTEQSTHPSKDIYFICYDQKYINENPYHLYDENKPGWLDHTTIPHTLIGAMLNIAIPIARGSKSETDKKVSILDPFVGSGTTYLELLKFPNIQFEGSDKSPLANIAVKDNVEFFSLDCYELQKLNLLLLCYELHVDENYNNGQRKDLINTNIGKVNNQEISNTNKKSDERLKISHLKKTAKAIYDDTISYFNNLSDDNLPEGELVSDMLEKVNQAKFLRKLDHFNKRILFYIFLKAYQRNLRAFKRHSQNWASVFTKEVADFRLQISNLIKLRTRAVANEKDNNRLIKYQGNYSIACSINPNVFIDIRKETENKCPIREKSNVIEELEKSKKFYDIIITDPPYGFNTEENTSGMAELYHKMLTLMIDRLNENGQLLLCLPEISNTGRQIHYFTQKEIIIHQVLIAASENKRSVVIPLSILPRPTWLFKAPYYWESEKALRRAILHFVIK